jgi:hypothetical protein
VKKISSLMTDRTCGLVVALLALSWLGFFARNSIELPSLNLFSPENSLPALVAVLLFIGWWLLPTFPAWRRSEGCFPYITGLAHTCSQSPASTSRCSRLGSSDARLRPSTTRTDYTQKVRFSATVGEEPEVEVGLV